MNRVRQCYLVDSVRVLPSSSPHRLRATRLVHGTFTLILGSMYAQGLVVSRPCALCISRMLILKVHKYTAGKRLYRNIKQSIRKRHVLQYIFWRWRIDRSYSKRKWQIYDVSESWKVHTRWQFQLSFPSNRFRFYIFDSFRENHFKYTKRNGIPLRKWIE
jgi:hypothetical protein